MKIIEIVHHEPMRNAATGEIVRGVFRRRVEKVEVAETQPKVEAVPKKRGSLSSAPGPVLLPARPSDRVIVGSVTHGFQPRGSDRDLLRRYQAAQLEGALAKLEPRNGPGQRRLDRTRTHTVRVETIEMHQAVAEKRLVRWMQ